MARRVTRQMLGAAWLMGVIVLLLLSAITQLADHFDRKAFVVRGGSMAPAIPQGALILVRAVDPQQVRVGDVVTLRTEQGAVLTHRVVGLRRASGELTLQTRGDANDAPDAYFAPSASIIGVVESYAPYLGFALAFLSTPSGLISAVAGLGTLLLARSALKQAPQGRDTRVTQLYRDTRVGVRG